MNTFFMCYNYDELDYNYNNNNIDHLVYMFAPGCGACRAILQHITDPIGHIHNECNRWLEFH